MPCRDPNPSSWLLGLALILLVGPGPGIMRAVLTPAPFDFSVSPSRVREESPVTVRIVPQATESKGDERYDIYIMPAFIQDALFLTPAGTWSRQPVPYLEAVSASQSTPVEREWPKAKPVGLTALTMVVVRASTSPLIRWNWAFQPSVQWLMVAPAVPASGAPRRAAAILVSLGLLSVGVSILVLLYPKRAER